MSFAPPEGWTKESPTRYRHESGILIRLTEEYGQKGWYIVPNNDDRLMRWFVPTPEGRDDAFRAFAENSARFHRKGPQAPDNPLYQVPCRNCGEKTSFGSSEIARAARGWCESCFGFLR